MEYRRRWYEANREKITAQHRVYREANHEKELERLRLYREANRETLKERQRLHYLANRDRLAKVHRLYYHRRVLQQDDAIFKVRTSPEVIAGINAVIAMLNAQGKGHPNNKPKQRALAIRLILRTGIEALKQKGKRK